MVFIISLLATIVLFVLMLFMFYVKQSQEVQMRRRLNAMIESAESERAKKNDSKKATEKKAPEKENKKSFIYKNFLSPIFDRLDEKLQNFTPAQIQFMLEEKIFLAGKSKVWSLKRVISFWGISVLLGTAAGVAVTYNIQLHFLQEIMIIFVGFIAGVFFLLLYLNSLIAKRKKIIRRTLPEFLDLLCVSVQAGLSFNGALQKITSQMSGPIVEEFKRMQSDINFGMTQQYALTQVAQRCDLEEMYLFASSVIQAERLGTGMGRTLKIQADNMRERHRQYVKAEALKAPVKMLFPMVLFIFPSIFVVVLFPTLYLFAKSMSGE